MFKKYIKEFSYKKAIKEFLTFALILFVVSNVISYVRKPTLSSSRLPAIVKKTINQQNFSFKEDRKRPLLIHFWATWCPTCKVEADNIQRLSEHYDVMSIAVRSGSDEELKQYMSERGFDYKVINDANGEIANLFSIGGYPTTFIYNSEGYLEFSEVGYTSTLGLFARMLWAN